MLSLSLKRSRLLTKVPIGRRLLATVVNAPQAKNFKINGDRLWTDIHETAKWSAPSNGGLSRLCATEHDKKARDWFRDQVVAMGADYKVNAVGAQFAIFPGHDNSIPPIAMGSHLDSVETGGKFDGPLGVIGALEIIRSFREQKIKTHAPLVVINWTNEEGARFFPLLGSSIVYAEQSTVNEAHASISTNNTAETMGSALASIGYIGDGPNTFSEFPISAHFEIHVEQHTDLENAGKGIGWFEGWQGMTWYTVIFHGDDGHANTKPMFGRRDTLVASASVITELENLAFEKGGDTTTVQIHSYPFGSCNIQSRTKVVFCLMHKTADGLEDMGFAIEGRIKHIARKRDLKVDVTRDIHLLPGTFWEEATECIRRACEGRGMATNTGTGHDSTMTTLLVPTGMVTIRAKDGISHSAKEWSSKEDCIDGVEVLGKAVLNFDEKLKMKIVV